MRSKRDNEGHNLFCGDYLFCSACGDAIFRVPIIAQYIRFRDIRHAYENHVKICFGIKRLIVKQRRK